jgi:lauroyl/myristoyl acyltransferase
MKPAAKILCIFIFRALERCLSARNLYRILKSPAFLVALARTTGKKIQPPPLPEFLRVHGSARLHQRREAEILLGNVLDYFPDRLATQKWKDYCRMNGFDRMPVALLNRRPVILAMVHFGPYRLTRAWLRSTGIPMAALVGGSIKKRANYRRRLDKYIPLPEVPVVFYLDQLRKISAFLAAGNVLAVMIDDIRAEKHLAIPFCQDWTFQMTTGAIRLALRHQAELIPCLITDEGGWHFRLDLGHPAPENIC